MRDTLEYLWFALQIAVLANRNGFACGFQNGVNRLAQGVFDTRPASVAVLLKPLPVAFVTKKPLVVPPGRDEVG